jgi:hypothetical protein
VGRIHLETKIPHFPLWANPRSPQVSCLSGHSFAQIDSFTILSLKDFKEDHVFLAGVSQLKYSISELQATTIPRNFYPRRVIEGQVWLS